VRITFNHPGVRFNEPGFTFNDFSGPSRRKLPCAFIFTKTDQAFVSPANAAPPVRATFNQPLIRFNEPGYTFNDMFGPRKQGAPRADVLTVVEQVFVSPPGAGAPERITFNHRGVRFNEPGYTFNSMFGPRRVTFPQVFVSRRPSPTTSNATK